METVFLKVFNMSLTASWLIGALILLRLLLKKMPKWVCCGLWVLVAIRLICPILLESTLSLIPSAETVSTEILFTREPEIHSGIPAVNGMVNPVISETFAPDPAASVNPMQVFTMLAAHIWMLGMLVMLVYALISYWRVRRRVRASLHIRDTIWICDEIRTPFLLGIVKPRIYLPSGMEPQQQDYVIAHEQAHLLRRDHWWKPLGYLLLILHWFNPVVWLAYILLCRDIELACDEKVIKDYGLDDRKAYSQALLSCSISRRRIAACPLAFGEVGVKERVRSVLNYKKPAFWVVVAAVLVSVVLAVCFLTNPPQDESTETSGANSEQTNYEDVIFTVKSISGDGSMLVAELYNGTEEELVYGDEILIYRDNVCITPNNMAWDSIGYTLKPGEKAELQVDLSAYHFSETGTYRAEKELCIGEESYVVTAEFAVEVQQLPDTPHPTFNEGRFSITAGKNDERTLVTTYRTEDGKTHGIYLVGIAEFCLTDDAGQKHNLSDVLKKVYLTVAQWLEMVQQQSIGEDTYRDGGSIMYKLDSVRVLKCHRLDAPGTYCQDIYIGTKDSLEPGQILMDIDGQKPQITIEDVIRLSEQDELTPRDFVGYQYRGVGSGLDIWQFELGELFTIGLINWGMDEPLDAVMLSARDGTDTYINICTDDVRAYYDAHKNNPVVPELLRGSITIPMEDSSIIADKMLQLGAPLMEPGSAEVLPYYPVQSVADLKKFRAEFEEYFDYSDTPDGYLTFAEAMDEYHYDEAFFETKEVIFVYYSGRTGREKPQIQYARQYNGDQLRIAVQAVEKTALQEKRGWLISIELDKGTMASSQSTKVTLNVIEE